MSCTSSKVTRRADTRGEELTLVLVGLVIARGDDLDSVVADNGRGQRRMMDNMEKAMKITEIRSVGLLIKIFRTQVVERLDSGTRGSH